MGCELVFQRSALGMHGPVRMRLMHYLQVERVTNHVVMAIGYVLKDRFRDNVELEQVGKELAARCETVYIGMFTAYPGCVQDCADHQQYVPFIIMTPWTLWSNHGKHMPSCAFTDST